jgi:hypothetical protein
MSETVSDALLGPCRKLEEARLIFERFQLLLKRETLGTACRDGLG